MKYILLISFWAGMLWSCREVTYSEPQPAGIASMKEVPPSLRGYFQTIDPASGEFSDTLIIESWGYHMKDKNDKDWLGRGVLSDSILQRLLFCEFQIWESVGVTINQARSGWLDSISFHRLE